MIGKLTFKSRLYIIEMKGGDSMEEVNIYVINGMVTVETKDKKVLHRMSGFSDKEKLEAIVGALSNFYVVLEVYD